ncbi:GIN domain-containing protein [Croceivirga sp. JEA036]|uniref:GIN domain-containing protein n=1 Tax=Croceivirga sp. JEA036 TaxID=2721162 RepID=UPI00143A5953|nr:DUF2807 domain-containing protein [Croceivirga sp. JEA036]NJB36237.1 hypothetical protein [Croceivirga sp. JEA036]
MKNLKAYSVCLLLLTSYSLLAQKKPKIKGNRVVTEVSGDLEAFNTIELRDDLEIILKKSFSEGYKITADDNLVDIIELEVQDSSLVISSYYDIKSSKKLEIEIGFKTLKSISQKSGNIKVVDRVKTDIMYINLLGNSKLELNTSAILLNTTMEENSFAKLNADVDSLNVFLRGKADLELVTNADGASVSVADSSDLDIDGSASEVSLTVVGNGKYKGEMMAIANLDFVAKDDAFSRIHCNTLVNLDLSGKSKTFLYANPEISLNNFMDTAQLLKKDN